VLENPLQVGGFAPQPRTVIDDLAVDLPGCKVDKAQTVASAPGPVHNSPVSFAFLASFLEQRTFYITGLQWKAGTWACYLRSGYRLGG
jgi:hypothetical protein